MLTGSDLRHVKIFFKHTSDLDYAQRVERKYAVSDTKNTLRELLSSLKMRPERNIQLVDR